MLTLLGKCGQEVWLIQCQMEDEVAASVPMPAGFFFLHPILTKDFSLNKNPHRKVLHCIAMVLVFKIPRYTS